MKKKVFFIIGIVAIICISFLLGLFIGKSKKEVTELEVSNEQIINNEQTINYDDYEKVSSLHSDTVSTEILVKFDGVLYGKSPCLIDYAGGTDPIGVIDKLIDSQYVPKLDGETNTKEILYATVFANGENEIVLLYNNIYVLFEKIK